MVMIRSLEQAISKIRNLPEDKQRLAAELLEEIASEGSYALTSDEKTPSGKVWVRRTAANSFQTLRFSLSSTGLGANSETKGPHLAASLPRHQ